MEKTLVVVESPAKAKTIKKYLGPGFEVKASVGHIKDLPEKSGTGFGRAEAYKGSVLGVDVDEGFRPHYQVIPGKEKVIKALQEAAAAAGRVFLATDPDREGEAIAWHLKEELHKPEGQVYRVLFNELTEKTIKEAIASPSRLDPNKYNAQQTRRILDRIVGYRLSPLLWDKVRFGLSAGRVQSVALRMIVDRQNAIDTFVPQEYWTITASLAAQAPPVFDARLVERKGKKLYINDVTEAQELVGIASANRFQVVDVTRRERTKKPPPPFITSTLQQEASRRLRLTGSRTMRIAQQLYEGIELGQQGAVGLITYMRTDSPRIADEALVAVRKFLKKKYGPAYVPDRPHVYKGRKSAQEAHEAIRPTSMDLTPEKVAPFLDKGQLALYTLIWNRFAASQAAPAIYDQTTASIACHELTFRVTGSIMKFDGFLKIYSQVKDDNGDSKTDEKEEADSELPPLKAGDVLTLKGLVPRQHFTQPPGAFNEASLIKELEEKGIGRPSTYAETVSTIQRRAYVELKDNRFRPTLLGRIIAGLLVDSFPQLLDARFTAEMESSLDLIEEGSTSWTETLANFYGPFQTAIEQAKTGMKNIKRDGIPTGESCPRCGEGLLLRSGRYGLFVGCSAYPDCDFTTNIAEESAPAKEPKPSNEICDCGSPMVIREGKTGPFLSCSRYPECKVARAISTGVKCPKCRSGEMAQRRTKKGKTFFSCNRYPQCDYSLWHRPVNVACPNPKCDSPIMEERFSKKDPSFLQCPQCKHRVAGKPDEPVQATRRGVK